MTDRTTSQFVPSERPDEVEPSPTVRLTSVTGAETPAWPDPTEDYHEASRVYPGVVDPLVVGAARLEQSAVMRATASRSVKRHAHLPFVALPEGERLTTSLEALLATRRSRREYADGPITLAELAALLNAAYGLSGTLSGSAQAVRTVPSGGALYPLDLYVCTPKVTGLDEAVYHFDPLRNGLELLAPLGPPDSWRDLTPYPQLLEPCAAFVVITGMLWRSRFKYGQRAYRFTLMEAGHVAQNFALAAEALRLASTPVGGFYDRTVDELVGSDGLYEVALYLLPVGRRTP